MIIQEDLYLEHYGVKGMRWGVRRKRGSSGQSSGEEKTPQQKAVAAQRKKMAKRYARNLAIAGASAGAWYISTKMNERPTTPTKRRDQDVRSILDSDSRFKVKVKETRKKNPAANSDTAKKLKTFFDNQPDVSDTVSKTKVKNFKKDKPKGKSYLESYSKDLAESKARLLKGNKEANAQMKSWYDDFQVPLPQREYLSETW